jgi:hypothetical protein
MVNESQATNETSLSTHVIETASSTMTIFLVLVIIIQNTILLSTIKIRSSPISILFISLSISDLILAIQSVISLLDSSSEVITMLSSVALIASLSVSSLIAVDKGVSLACPFFYSNIVTHSTVSKGVIIVWIVSISFSSSQLLIEIPKDDEDLAHPRPTTHLIALSSFYLLLLLVSCSCHLYVYKVAHRHNKTISKTQRSHHASMQRLNSICVTKRDSITPYPSCYLATSVIS